MIISRLRSPTFAEQAPSCLDIEGGITLRNLTQADVPEVFGTISANREFLSHTTPEYTEAITNAATLQQYIKDYEVATRMKMLAQYGIYRDEEHLGLAMLKLTQPKKMAAEIGIWLAEDATRQGIGRNVVSTLADYGLTHLGLRYVYGKVRPENEPSQKGLEKLGWHRTMIGASVVYVTNKTQAELTASRTV